MRWENDGRFRREGRKKKEGGRYMERLVVFHRASPLVLFSSALKSCCRTRLMYVWESRGRVQTKWILYHYFTDLSRPWQRQRTYITVKDAVLSGDVCLSIIHKRRKDSPVQAVPYYCQRNRRERFSVASQRALWCFPVGLKSPKHLWLLGRSTFCRISILACFDYTTLFGKCSFKMAFFCI